MRTWYETIAVCFFALVASYHHTPSFVRVVLHEENLLTASLCILTSIWRMGSARCEFEAGRRGFGLGVLAVFIFLLMDSTLHGKNKLFRKLDKKVLFYF
jgi:hypothetical protein